MIEIQGSVPAWVVYCVGAGAAVYVAVTLASVGLAILRIYLERQLKKEAKKLDDQVNGR